MPEWDYFEVFPGQLPCGQASVTSVDVCAEVDPAPLGFCLPSGEGRSVAPGPAVVCVVPERAVWTGPFSVVNWEVVG